MAARLARGLSAARRTFAGSPAAQPRRWGQYTAATLAAAGGYAYVAQPESLDPTAAEDVDALIIGGGIMGTTVAVMLKLLQPSWNVLLVEQLDRVGAESSNEWHNAGTGHAALCEVRPSFVPSQHNAQSPNTYLI